MSSNFSFNNYSGGNGVETLAGVAAFGLILYIIIYFILPALLLCCIVSCIYKAFLNNYDAPTSDNVIRVANNY